MHINTINTFNENKHKQKCKQESLMLCKFCRLRKRGKKNIISELLKHFDSQNRAINRPKMQNDKKMKLIKKCKEIDKHDQRSQKRASKEPNFAANVYKIKKKKSKKESKKNVAEA